ncbi:MAG: PepSY domain-containing protein [Kangiellaceae bacterium]|nr:PepSY domain-containing protein [Kangiellaceae bacterium]
MKRVSRLRKLHKWLALVTGLQILIWALSGFYMVSVDIDIIHGDHLVKTANQDPIEAPVILPISEQLIDSQVAVKSVAVNSYFGKYFYRIDSQEGTSIIDVQTGQIAKTLALERIREITAQTYTGDASISSIELLPQYPNEIRYKNQPIWRVVFDDLADSTLYFHYQTGQLISKRTDLWRIFDFLWKLHIIEYFGLDGYFGLLFRMLALLSLSMAIFGSFLLYYRLKPGVSQ